MSPRRSTIPFNKPFIAGKELFYVAQAVTNGNIGGDGHFTSACSRLLEDRFGIAKVLLTPSCTSALEMAAMLCELKPGDEVIMPSYTFVSTASAFVRERATPVFVDIRPDTLNIDENLIEAAITERTRAICVVHYAGTACEMAPIMEIANRHGLIVVEDAAQAVNSHYKGRPLGSIGDLACYSFHETKNYICGEGGALCINNERFVERAEIIRDKGTNRQKFFRGQVDKYTWVDSGSSYVPSEICSAFLYGQLEKLDEISGRRGRLYQKYAESMAPLAQHGIRLPAVPAHCESNSHLYYLVLPTPSLRDDMLDELAEQGIKAVFHYVPLHRSPMGQRLCGDLSLPVTEDLSARLLRLPLYYELTEAEQRRIIAAVHEFARNAAPKSEAPRCGMQPGQASGPAE